MYINGVNNYETYVEAEKQFSRLETKAALCYCKDGAATISFLQDKPVYPGQVEYNPIGSNVKLNFNRV